MANRKSEPRKTPDMKNPHNRKPSQFSSRRQYLNALAQDNGFANYYQWLKHRKQTGQSDLHHVLAKKRKKLEDTGYTNNWVYTFKFRRGANHGQESYIQNERMIDYLVKEDLKKTDYIRIMGHVFHYKGKEAWTWVSTSDGKGAPIMQINDFLRLDLIGDETILEWMSRVYSIRPSSSQDSGFREVRVVVHSPKKLK